MPQPLPLGPGEYSHGLTVRKDGRFYLSVTGLYAPQVREMLAVLLGPAPGTDRLYGGVLSQGCPMPETELATWAHDDSEEFQR